jgi:hypothetical protein
MEKVENRVSAMKHKVEALHQTVKVHKRMQRKCEWDMQDIWDTMRDQTYKS